MPTSTFFHLPEEKQQRLLEASWEEFTRTSFSDASINRIIRAADIPRGSFYQYFADKEDLFVYLLEEMRQYFSQRLGEMLLEAGGDLFALTLGAYDRFIREQEDRDPVLDRCIRLIRVNRGLDIQRLMNGKPRCLADDLWNLADLSLYRRKDREFVEHVFFLLIMALASAVMEVLQNPGHWEGQRQRLETCIEIIRSGSVVPDEVRTQQGGVPC